MIMELGPIVAALLVDISKQTPNANSSTGFTPVLECNIETVGYTTLNTSDIKWG